MAESLVVITLFYSLFRFVRYKEFYLPTILSFISHFGLSLSLYWTIGLTNDANLYNSAALKLSQSWDFSTFHETVPPGKQLLSIISASIYSLFGDRIIIVIAFLSFLFALLPSITYVTCVNFGFKSSARLASWSTILLPQPLIWSSLINREGLNILTLAFLFYVLSLIYLNNSVSKYWYLLLFIVLISFNLRTQLLISLGFSTLVTTFLFIYIKFGFSDFFTRRNGFQLIFATIIFFVSIGLYFGNSGTNILSSEVRVETVAALSMSSTSPAQGTTPQESSVAPGGESKIWIFEFIKPTIGNFLLSTFGPLVPNWNSLKMVVLGIDGLILMLFFGIILLSLRKPGPRRVVSLISLSIAMPLLLASSYIFSNYGLSARIRDITLLILSITVIDRINELYLKRKEVYVTKNRTKLS